jgi:hypothetical protein
VAFNVRSFDWSGPDLIDRTLTITKNPAMTSFGQVSMQLRTAATTAGFDPATLSTTQWRNLADCLQHDIYNITLAARHLRQLIDHDGLQTSPPALSTDAMRVAGARYNRGIGLTLESIRRNTRYGDFIVKFLPRLQKLLQ